MSRDEQQTGKDLIEPALEAAGWHWEREVLIGPGRVNLTGEQMYDASQKLLVDYVLRVWRMPLAVLEAKAEGIPVADGVQQGSRYANRQSGGGAIATNKKCLLSRHALLDPNLMAVVPHDERLRSAYHLAWFWTFDLQQIASGGVVPQLTKRDLAPLEIPVPTLAKQDELIEEVETIRASSRALVTTYPEAVADTNQLTQAVHRKAFTGEL